jgi:thioredoxin
MGDYTEDLTTAADLDALMQEGGGAAIIDFWAPWCGPCKMMGPAFDAVAEEYADEDLAFYKLNTEDHGQLAARFNIRSIPTLVLVNDGEILDVVVGAQSHKQIQKRARWLSSKSRGEGFWGRLFG